MQDNKFNNGVYSKRVRAGKRRTYFFDVRTTRSNDYFLTITESKRRFDNNGYERHKLHIYKEDFNKFIAALEETVNYVKTELMPDYDFDMYSRQYDEDYQHPGGQENSEEGGAEVSVNENVESTTDAETETETTTETEEDEDLSWD